MNRSDSRVEALFVIHQDTDLSRLGDICRMNRFSSVVILSTHRLFKNEHQRAVHVAPSTRILTFADLLTDSEMASCDERSTSDLLRPPAPCNTHRINSTRFMRNTRRYQNELIHQKIIRMHQPTAVYFDDGLGVDGNYWSARGAVCLPYFSARLTRNLKNTAHDMNRRLHSAVPPGFITAVSNGAVCYIFLASPRRLRFSDRVQIHTRALPCSQKIAYFASARARAKIFGRVVDSLPSSVGEPRLAATIHQYRHELSEMGRPLFLFVDGYHPPNYPQSYLDMYPENCIFVVNHMFNAGWFQHHRRQTCRSLPFLRPPVMRRVEDAFPQSQKTILLALNHAGDWTSLIQRSDTDILLEAFAEAAERYADFEFIVRPHPTMADPAHEGIHALERIREYIAWKKLSNLHLSVEPLEQDMQRGDLFVSEYSQVLIDAFQNGKLGIIANLTARRSFMQPYEALGFCSANSGPALEERIRTMCTNPQESIERQNLAVGRYNDMLKEQGYCYLAEPNTNEFAGS